MQPATAETVLADFDGATFEQFGVTTRFRRDGDRFVVETEGPDGATAAFDVAYTFGVDPLQQYLIDLGGGKLHALTIAWDVSKGAWFSLYPDEAIRPGDPLHWAGRLQRWNTMCADCHSTALRRGYSVSEDAYHTSWAELDVGCEACHGPGAAHVAWARGDRKGGDGLAVHFVREAGSAVPANAERELDVCAPCHSRRHAVSDGAVVGEPFLDHYMPSLLDPPLYHVDGQVHGEVYVWGSFAQSLMHRRGVRCSDCHEPHGLGLRAEGNALCGTCHGEEPNPRFPTLARRAYDTKAHHLHDEGSPGARCVACHMPEATFMEIDGRRDHSLRIPRPDLSIALGTPNACNGCHADRDAAWAAARIAAARPLDRPPRAHYGEALADGGFAALSALVADADAPAIARATAVERLPLSDGAADDVRRVLLAALGDESPLVRASSVRALERFPSDAALAAVLAALDDERRAVRVEAARVLGAIPEERLSPHERSALARAVAEFRDAQLAVGDTPGAHLNLGVLHERRGHAALAEESYRTAIGLAPEFVPARVNLANLYNALGRNDDAEEQLRAALATVERWPPADGSSRDRGELHYSLGLLLAETGRLPEAEVALGLAVDELPGRARVRYNHALALQQLGRPADAERVLLEAAARAPEDPDVQRALAILFVQAGDPRRALPHAERALALSHGPEHAQLVETIRARIAAAER